MTQDLANEAQRTTGNGQQQKPVSASESERDQSASAPPAGELGIPSHVNERSISSTPGGGNPGNLQQDNSPSPQRGMQL